MSIGTRLYNSLAILGIAVSVLGIVFGLVVWLVTPDTRVSIVWPLAVGGGLLALCCMLADMLRASIAEGELKLPRILACLGDVAHVVSGRLLLVQPSRLLGHGMAVSIYIMQNEFEILIGDGVVQNIQQDHRVQVAVMGVRDGTDAIWAELIANRPDALKSTLVRPGNQYSGPWSVTDYDNLPRVAHVLNQSEAVINKGKDDGIALGAAFLVFSKGPEVTDPVTGKSLGELEVLRGKGKVIHLQARLATVRCTESTPVYDSSSVDIFALTPRRPVRYEDIPFRGISVGDLARPI
jgi:hypothetical protein